MSATANPNPYAFDLIAASDARDRLVRDRDDALEESVSAALEASNDPAIQDARRALHTRQRVSTWFVLGGVASLAIMFGLAASVHAGFWIGVFVVAFVVFVAFNEGALSLAPNQHHLSSRHRAALHAYARARGIQINLFTQDIVDADLLGGWTGQDDYNVRTDRLHPDLADTQALLNQWAADDAKD